MDVQGMGPEDLRGTVKMALQLYWVPIGMKNTDTEAVLKVFAPPIVLVARNWQKQVSHTIE